MPTKVKDGFTSPSFPASMPEKYQNILASAYASCRKKWVSEHPDDRENKSSKERCAKVAWAAVKRAGYTKEFQMPNPADYTDQNEWMQICVPTLINEGKSQEDAKAQCFAMWQNKTTGQLQPNQPDRKSKIDILKAIKSLFEKNGYQVEDDKIIEMFSSFGSKGFLTKLNKKLDFKTHEIKILPKKKVFIEKYGKEIDLNDQLFDQMITAFNSSHLFRPFIDEDHQLGVKFADIHDLLKKEDGLYAKIELNKRGLEAIKNKDYSYVSPEWGNRIDTDGTEYENALCAVTLTNIPALEGELPTLQEQIKLTKGGKYMENKIADFEKKINRVLAKVDTITLNKKLQAEGEMPADVMKIIEELGAMLQEAMAKIAEITQAKGVAEGEAQAVQEELNQFKKAKEEKEKEEFFSKAIEDGQVEMKELDKWKEHWNSNKQFVKDMISNRTKNKNIQLAHSIDSKTKEVKLTQHDYDIMNEHSDRYIDEKTGEYLVHKYKKDILDDISHVKLGKKEVNNG